MRLDEARPPQLANLLGLYGQPDEVWGRAARGVAPDVAPPVVGNRAEPPDKVK